LDQKNLKVDNLSFSKVKEILTIKKIGTKIITFYGGDQLLHPDFKEMVFYAIEEGFHIIIPCSGLISKSDATWLVEAQKISRPLHQDVFIGMHIDTLDQDVYNQINHSPDTLQAKLKGYETLLNAGFPPDRVYGCPALTKQTAETMIPLMDFFYEKGAKNVAMNLFRPCGLSRENGAKYEPTLSQIKKLYEYRASIEGEHLLLAGTSDGKNACKYHIGVTYNGDVVPCLTLRDFSGGNINQENIVDILKKSKKTLMLKVKVKGPCGSCENKLFCYGCRANAYLYTGDICASDPKCFFNKDAPESCLN
jgi:radical SAM protein with 4Fe4S-binding SPASM domain